MNTYSDPDSYFSIDVPSSWNINHQVMNCWAKSKDKTIRFPMIMTTFANDAGFCIFIVLAIREPFFDDGNIISTLDDVYTSLKQLNDQFIWYTLSWVDIQITWKIPGFSPYAGTPENYSPPQVIYSEEEIQANRTIISSILDSLVFYPPAN